MKNLKNRFSTTYNDTKIKCENKRGIMWAGYWSDRYFTMRIKKDADDYYHVYTLKIIKDTKGRTMNYTDIYYKCDDVEGLSELLYFEVR